jgi:DNA-binding beta-propeller fold protein YncE
MGIGRLLWALCILWIGFCPATCYGWRETYEFVLEWGTPGSDTGQLSGPIGMCADKDGFVYVSEQHNHRIQKFDSLGNFVMMFGSLGTSNGQFNAPQDVAVDDSGNIYVTDGFNCRVQKFDSLGGFLLVWGDTGSAPGEFLWPEGIAVDSMGNIYVTDGGNRRVQIFDHYGNVLGQLYSPDSFRWDPMSVADHGSEAYVYTYSPPNNVQRFDSLRQLTLEWSKYGTAPGECIQIGDIDTDQSGSVYVIDSQLNRCQKFDANGRFITLWGAEGTEPGQFDNPMGIAIDPDGRVYVSDYGNNRIQRFRKAH